MVPSQTMDTESQVQTSGDCVPKTLLVTIQGTEDRRDAIDKGAGSLHSTLCPIHMCHIGVVQGV